VTFTDFIRALLKTPNLHYYQWEGTG